MNYDLPDPERAQKNIETFLSENPEYSERLKSALPQVSMLFSHSQFLANYCIRNPQALFDAVDNRKTPFDTEQTGAELRELFASCSSADEGMKAVRRFKKNKLLIITLKDILKEAELQESMLELSMLADAILRESLIFMETQLRKRFGTPENNSIVVIGLGKLGANELNYSSDVDITFVYRDEGETSGIATVQGVVMNRVTAFEYYTKLAEEFTRFLSINTGDGFAYRVDLRLRPQGQRGNLALSLRSYEEYYESWGQLWEKAALLRARPVAGDMELGQEFLKMIKPFVYRKYLDFDAIDEIRRMKSQVEQIKAGTLSKDIKRGYGGIREIEFFIQIFQLIYGGKEPLLRERSTLKALHKLVQKGLIGYEDMHHLSDNYIFLRTLEHRLQQLNDLQTHAIPAGDLELDIVGRKMGFPDRTGFLSELVLRRRKVREIYDSLLESKRTVPEQHGVLSAVFWDMETPNEQLLTEELLKSGIRDTHKTIHCLMRMRSSMYSFQTLKGRRLLEEVLPGFVDDALKGQNPELVLLQLVDFSAILAAKESYLEIISQRPEIISALNFIFSQSEYLSKILMSNPEYIESLVEGGIIKKSLKTCKNELSLLIEKHGESPAVRLFKRSEEIRLGMRFLNKKISVTELMKSLTKTAEAILSSLLPISPPHPPLGKGGMGGYIIGFGKLGGREITFNSDLDIIFITQDEPSEEDVKTAQKLLKIATSYTKDGIAYRIDTRLRPEGSKGPLVSSLEGIRNYYLRDAQIWELQALLKARPINGSRFTVHGSRTHIYFMEIRKEILMKRGGEITLSDIKKMRERIQKELSKESISSGVYDIKLGAGGLEEIEFIVQYLQLKNCKDNPHFLVQGTLDAIKRLNKNGVINNDDAVMMSETYIFYRTVETILRLRNESVLKEGSRNLTGIARFLDMEEERFLGSLHEKKERVEHYWNKMDS